MFWFCWLVPWRYRMFQMLWLGYNHNRRVIGTRVAWRWQGSNANNPIQAHITYVFSFWKGKDNREIKIHVYPERQTWICTTWPSFSPHFPFTVYCFYTKISSFMPALSIRIALDCFYLLIFYFEKFSTDVCRLPYAVNVNLNLSNIRCLYERKIWIRHRQ